jgi:hypothetical protein
VTVEELAAILDADVPTEALRVLLNAAQETVEERLGSIGPLTETHRPSGPLIGLARRALEVLAVVERRVALDPSAYVLRPSGRILERAHPHRWHGPVEVTYQPYPDTGRRDGAIEALVRLDINHNPGVVGFKFGSFSETYAQQGGLSYEDEREGILTALLSDGGFVL